LAASVFQEINKLASWGGVMKKERLKLHLTLS
jgi:hypothetical protein